jgi:hypothetical protein
LNSIDDNLILLYQNSSWYEIARSVQRDFLYSSAESGYTYLPNGLIFQWGKVADAGAATTATFPITYPNAALNVVTQIQDTTANYQSTTVEIISTSQFKVRWDSVSPYFFYQSIGY